LNREGYSEYNVSTELLKKHFEVKISNEERIAKGLMDNGSMFFVTDFEKGLHLHEIKRTDLQEKSEENHNSSRELRTPDDTDAHAKIYELFDQLIMKESEKEDLYCLNIEFKKIKYEKEDNMIPDEIFNIEFLLPSDDFVSAVNQIHIPYLKSSGQEDQGQMITLVIRLSHCLQGSLDIGISFTDRQGNIYFGVLTAVELKLRDCFLKNDFSMSPLAGIQLNLSETLSETETYQLLFYYYQLQRYNLSKSVRSLKCSKDKILEKYDRFFRFFEIHRPYLIKGNDTIAKSAYEFLFPNSPFPENEGSSVILEEKTIARIIIKLPGK